MKNKVKPMTPNFDQPQIFFAGIIINELFYQKLNRHQSSSEKSKRLDLKRVKEQDLKLAMLGIPSLKSLGTLKGRF